MKKMTIFENKQFGAIRTVCDESGYPWLMGVDVAKRLGYKNPQKAIHNHVDDEDKTVNISFTINGTPPLLINESGLYSLVIKSKMKDARNFRRWITSEVLPSIRKDGGYIVVRSGESDEVIVNRAVNILQKTLQCRDEQIALLQPKAAYTDEVLESVSCFTITQIAKELDMTANELNRFLCRKHIQYGQSGQYLPYAQYARKGFTRNRTHWEERRGGRLFTKTYLVWTERGRQFIHRLVKGVA